MTSEQAERIESLLRDYSWMVREADRLQRRLYSGSSSVERSWGVAQYGIDAAMPKGSSIKSQAELAEMDSREMWLLNRIESFKKKIKAIESAANQLKGEMHKVVYDCMLDGMSFRSIARHLGLSRDRVRQIKDEIIVQLSQNDQFRQLLKLEKNIC